MRVFNGITQRTDQWVRLRAGRPTASRFAQIITPGGKPSTSANSYMIELCAGSLRPDEIQWEGNVHTDRGEALEPEARELFSELTGLAVVTVGFVIRDEPYISGCSPDGLIVDADGNYTAGLELKAPLAKEHAAYLIDGGISAKYIPQVHGSMAVTGLRVWYFMSYCPGLRPHIVKAEWNEYTDAMIAELNRFEERYTLARPSILKTISPES